MKPSVPEVHEAGANDTDEGDTFAEADFLPEVQSDAQPPMAVLAAVAVQIALHRVRFDLPGLLRRRLVLMRSCLQCQRHDLVREQHPIKPGQWEVDNT